MVKVTREILNNLVTKLNKESKGKYILPFGEPYGPKNEYVDITKTKLVQVVPTKEKDSFVDITEYIGFVSMRTVLHALINYEKGIKQVS